MPPKASSALSLPLHHKLAPVSCKTLLAIQSFKYQVVACHIVGAKCLLRSATEPWRPNHSRPAFLAKQPAPDAQATYH
eukprot:3316881-Amphidinium_carterae.1